MRMAPSVAHLVPKRREKQVFLLHGGPQVVDPIGAVHQLGDVLRHDHDRGDALLVSRQRARADGEVPPGRDQLEDRRVACECLRVVPRRDRDLGGGKQLRQ
jgi:hypothetical protein